MLFPLLAALTLVLQPSPISAQNQPNPIRTTYPNNVTGTINGTIVVIPIPFSLARSIIPSQYAILPSYRKFFPASSTLGSGSSYPFVLEAVYDHDVGQGSLISIPDFSSVRLTFPFVDLLGDGYSTFRYAPDIFLGPNPIAVAGAVAYGESVSISTFNPANLGYAAVLGSTTGQTYFNVYAVLDLLQQTPVVSTLDKPYAGPGADLHPLSFYANATNQPQFANGASCDNMVRFFNTRVTKAPYLPRPVTSRVVIAPGFTGAGTYDGVQGLQLDTAFIENNYLPCSNFKGYSYSGQ